MSELAVLQGLRMKGRATSSLLAAVTGLSLMEVESILAVAVDTDLMVSRGSVLRLTALGRERLDELLATERRQVNQTALGELYCNFIRINVEIKEAVSTWQLRDDGTPNDHTDAAYDAAAVARLIALDGNAGPTLWAISAVVPRLTRYVARLELARAKIASHDHRYIASPTVNCYHQAWFELHEELLTLLGLSRQAEDVLYE